MITSDSRALAERKAVVWVVRALSYLVYFYLIVVEIVLFIGFFLLLFGANPSAGFTQWAYRNLDRVMARERANHKPSKTKRRQRSRNRERWRFLSAYIETLRCRRWRFHVFRATGVG